MFLGVLRCFTSPRSLPIPMYSVWDDPVLPEPGFPIRKSPDRSLFSSSPKLIAANHALHRLLAPRHPPYALSSLTIFAITTLRITLLYTRIQFSKNNLTAVFQPTGDWPKGPVINDRVSRIIDHYSLNSILVELIGIEPTTSGLQNRRSPN